MSTGRAESLGRRARNKRRTRDAIEQAAWPLFLRDGVDAAKVDDIATAAGVASRTFFRYFESKEAVLFGDWRPFLDLVQHDIVTRPAVESPFEASWQTLLRHAERFDGEPRLQAQRTQLARASSLIANYQRLVVMPAWEDAVCDALARRLRVEPADDARPRLFATVSVAVLHTVHNRWRADGGRDALTVRLDAAFAEIAASTADHPSVEGRGVRGTLDPADTRREALATG
jgi:AcrR family transcriptional regulator